MDADDETIERVCLRIWLGPMPDGTPEKERAMVKSLLAARAATLYRAGPQALPEVWHHVKRLFDHFVVPAAPDDRALETWASVESRLKEVFLEGP